MKVETLLELIGEIDDSFVEEATFGKKRISKMPWNLVATAACLCLVITTLVVLRSAGLLPVAPIPTDPTQTTQPTETTAPTETTVPPTTSGSPSRKELDDIQAAIGTAMVELGKKTESDYETADQYQLTRSLLSNVEFWYVNYDDSVVEVHMRTLTDSTINAFRKYIYDAPYLRFCDFYGNYLPRTDPTYENTAYDAVTNASEGLEFTLSTDGTYYLVTGIGVCTDTEIVIPSEKDGLPVRAIRFSAFANQAGITGITVPNSVVSIESCAFSGCDELTSVILPDSLQSIGTYAFSNCGKLNNIALPSSATNLGEGLFYGCTGLTDIALPQGTTAVSAGMFYGCTGLVSVTIPDSVTDIGPTAFYECAKLTKIRIPENVRSIGTGAFYGCSGLIDIHYAGTIQRWNSIIQTDLLSQTIRCTDGNAISILTQVHLLNTIDSTGLSYVEWLYRYCYTINAYLGEKHEEICAIQNISQFTDKNGDLIIRHQCGDRSEAYVEIPWNPHAGTLSEESEIYEWFFRNSTSGANGEAWRSHLAPAFASDPEAFINHLSSETDARIESIATFISHSKNSNEREHYIAQCESIRDTAANESVRKTAQRMLDALS